MGYLDLHSHVLAGLDDGAKALDQSVELATLLGHLGFEIVCATPHQKQGFFSPSREQIDTAHQALRAALAAQGIAVEVRLGAENFWDEVFLERARTSSQPAYDGGLAFLFEIDPRLAPPRLEEQLFQIRVKGLLPVLAHPERYAPFWDAPDRLEAIGRGAALVVDLGALDGAHGPRQCQAARWLLTHGVAHAVASDIHSPGDARAVGAGLHWIEKKLGSSALVRLLEENPRRILQGDLPD